MILHFEFISKNIKLIFFIAMINTAESQPNKIVCYFTNWAVQRLVFIKPK